MATIALDVDNTVFDILTPWLKMYREKTGDLIYPEDIQYYFFVNDVEFPDVLRSILALPPDQGVYHKIRPYAGCAHVVQTLREEGNEVVFVTINDAPGKRIALYEHGLITSDGQMVVTANKSTIGKTADVLVDDCPKYLYDYLAGGGKHTIRYVANHYYNRDDPVGIAARSWMDIYFYIHYWKKLGVLQ